VGQFEPEWGGKGGTASRGGLDTRGFVALLSNLRKFQRKGRKEKTAGVVGVHSATGGERKKKNRGAKS